MSVLGADFGWRSKDVKSRILNSPVRVPVPKVEVTVRKVAVGAQVR